MKAMKKSSFIELQGQSKKRFTQYLDIKVTFEQSNGVGGFDQLLEKIDISKCMNETYDSIILKQLLELLHLSYNIPIEDKEVFYYLPEGEVFVNCGVAPISEEVRVDLGEVDVGSCMHLKIRGLGLMHVERLMLTQVGANENQKDEEEPEEDEGRNGKKQGRRMKERRIDHIIGKVIEWRKYYSGTVDEHRQHQKLSLEEAAKKVGISKKSLDDYLFQIRLGFNFGFNFNEHYGQKVGILRDFVRQAKKSSKAQSKSRKRKNKQHQ